jgi:DNA polymerase III epsilon subunit-like protein
VNNQLCILDIETTGFEPEDSEILELYILKVKDNEIIDEFYSLFNTKQNIENSHIHGITNEKVKDSPYFEEKSLEIREFVKESVLVGHNINYFDLKFLNYYLDQPLNNKTIDTVLLSRTKLNDKIKNHKLITIAEYFDVSKPTHSAKDDVITTFEIYKKLSSIQ